MHSTELKRFPSQLRQGWQALSAFIGWFAAALLLVTLAVPAYAQYNASLQGTVEDTTGAVVPGATITLVDKETGRTIGAVSGDTGLFTFNELAPSKYTITVARDGFKKKVLDNVAILAEQAASLTVKLEVGGSAETVTVNAAEQPVMDTETGNVGATITQNDLAKMPDFGRDPLQLLQLAPGMFGDAAQNNGGGGMNLPHSDSNPGPPGNASGLYTTENHPPVTANGGRDNSNGIMIDGVQSTSVTWGSGAVITPNPDTLKEVNVISNPYDAEYGRFSGAQIQMITENGTNNWHGTGLFKMDRPGLNALQRWDPNGRTKDTALYNEFGGTVGGPIFKNHLFFFFGYDSIRNNATNVGSGWYDTAEFDGESATGTIANKFLTVPGINVNAKQILEGPSDGHGCADIGLVQVENGVGNCNLIQGQGLDIGRPLTIGLGQHDPSFANPANTANGTIYTPGLGGDGTGNPATNLDGTPDLFYVQTQGPNNTVSAQYNGRLDYQLTDKDLIAGNIYYVPQTQNSYSDRPMNIYHHTQLNYSMGLLYNHTFSSSTLNEARVDMAGWRWNDLASNPQQPLGLPSDNISLNNGPSFSNITPSALGPQIGSVFDQWTLNFKDVVTKVYKSHNLKFGGQYTRLAYEDAPTWAGSANFYFNNYWDFLNDAPETEVVNDADPRTGIPTDFRKDDRQYIPSVFAQDNWKVKPNLTLNLGVRWEEFAGMTEKKNNNPRVNLGSGSDLFTDLAIVVDQPQVDAQKGNIAPQFGFAWSPARDSGKVVIHGGIGIGYNGLEMGITTNTRFDPPTDVNSEGTPLTGNQILYQTGSNIYQYGSLPANPYLKVSFNSANLPTTGNQEVTGVDPKLKTSYVLRYSFDAEYDLSHDWVATLGYSGSSGRHLANQVNLYDKYATQLLAGQVAFNGAVSGLDWFEDTATSNFNSMLAELRHQFSHTFQADAQYRWSHSLDNSSVGNATHGLDYQFLPGKNWGSSDYDVRNMIKLFGMWTPELFHGNSLLEKAVGGWTLSPIFNFHTGFPFDVVFEGEGQNAVFANSSSNGGSNNGNLRPVRYLGGAYKKHNTDSFKSVAAGDFPNGGAAYFVGQNVVQGGSWGGANGQTPPTPTALPLAPGVGRNAYTGPVYSDLDLALTKAFGLPKMPVLGENSRIELRANAFNLFNKININNGCIDNNISNAGFGSADGNSADGGCSPVLGSRTVEVEAHFKF